MEGSMKINRIELIILMFHRPVHALKPWILGSFPLSKKRLSKILFHICFTVTVSPAHGRYVYDAAIISDDGGDITGSFTAAVTSNKNHTFEFSFRSTPHVVRTA